MKNHTEMGKCWHDSEEESKTRVNHVAKMNQGGLNFDIPFRSHSALKD